MSVLTWVRRCGAPRRLAALASSSDAACQAMAQALADVMARRFSPEELTWVRSIEALRVRLLRSAEPVSITDFGAVMPGAHQTAEAMSQGRVVTRQVGQICQAASKSRKWTAMLFHLIRRLRPSHCVEMGTCLGVSAAYQVAALELNGQGMLTTLEGAEHLAALARMHLSGLGLTRFQVVVGRFQDTLPGVLRAQAPIDFVFIDGHHDGEATVRYYRQLLPHLADGAVVVLDDIAWSGDMERAWRTIAADRHVAAAVDLVEVGLCVVRRSIQGSVVQIAAAL